MQRGSEIVAHRASVTYPGASRPALDDVSLTIPSGELLVVVGPSGCGKSTLLRTINRLIPLTGGSITIDGTDVAALDPVALRRGIGYAIQAVGLFAHMRVGENIAIVPELLGWQRERIAERVDALLRLVHLEPSLYRERFPRELSGGEAQRVGVARAIAGDPRVLLMDEPFGAVDAIVRSQLQDELQRLVRELGTTTLFVTHDVDEALHIADRIAIVNHGRIEQLGAPIELLRAPATPFVERLFHANDAVIELRAKALAQRTG
ncbi:MAG: ABC transporter ATP-binding protein [Vulcanimicrobiaceae bacterium]